MRITPGDISLAFRQCGVKSGDVLMLHADAMVLAQLQEMDNKQRYDIFFEALDETLGPLGTLILPTYTYNFTKNENYSSLESPSTVGDLTEYFRHMPGVVRSHDPIFSIAVKGHLAKEYMATSSENSFGPESIFALMAKHDARIACLGCSLDRITFIHFIEQMSQVDYRYLKTFSGHIVSEDRQDYVSVRYFVRDLKRDAVTDTTRLKRHLEEKSLLTKASIGRVGLNVISAAKLLEEGAAMLESNPVSLIREGKVVVENDI